MSSLVKSEVNELVVKEDYEFLEDEEGNFTDSGKPQTA